MKKTCRNCGETKSLKRFQPSELLRKTPRCRECMRKLQKERHNRAREFVRTLKENTPCTDCGEKYPYYVLDFDHIGKKIKEVNSMVKKKYSITRIRQEIEKCEIVCANCHRVRTHTRRHKNTPKNP